MLMLRILYSLLCGLSVVALLAIPLAQAAPAKHKRIQVQYTSGRVAKKPVPARKFRPVKRESVDFSGTPDLKSAAALVVDFTDGHTIYRKNPQTVTPIASITKLMTAMVTLDADPQLDEAIRIDTTDLDMLKHTSSRLSVGTTLPRREMLRLALMSSENRAASALARAYPGGREAFISAMNHKADSLEMSSTQFFDSTGLTSKNVSTAEDLVKMVKAAYQYPLIRQFTTTSAHEVETATGRSLQFRNSNGLVRSSSWEIGLSKTGYISEAGRCLVMQAKIGAHEVVIVLLDSLGRYTRTADANRIKKWLESGAWRKPYA